LLTRGCDWLPGAEPICTVYNDELPGLQSTIKNRELAFGQGDFYRLNLCCS